MLARKACRVRKYCVFARQTAVTISTASDTWEMQSTTASQVSQWAILNEKNDIAFYIFLRYNNYVAYIKILGRVKYEKKINFYFLYVNFYFD